MKLPVCDITPFTLQDFPDHVACILWFGGCNMRCVYCHNPELVLGKKDYIPWHGLNQFLKERAPLLQGVVLSGGECTLYPQLLEFTTYLHNMGYKIKLDTNGLRPDILKKLIDNQSIDYVALDYKAPDYKFLDIVKRGKFSNFKRSLELLCTHNIAFEIRTTIHTDLLNEDDIISILNDLDHVGFKGNYYIQNYQTSPLMLNPMPPQQRTLDINALPNMPHFKIHHRNF